jgi:hypothetical protein
MNVNDNLIVKFRDTVNSNSNFVLHSYQSRDGKNHWNIICSCMDWISVSIRFLSKNISLDEDIDVRVMQFFSIISAVFIVHEAINQLHRVIFNNNTIPYHQNIEIFKNNKLGLDDNSYFKELRAMFGAHPVNLKQRDNEKWYASWPYDHYKSEDSTFELRLYSNKVGVDDITFGVNINDIEKFLKQRYEYLSELEIEINNQYASYCKKYVDIPILADGSPQEILSTLEQESKKRLDNDYYKGIIFYLQKIFSTNLNEDHLKDEEKQYKELLLKLIFELRNNLQQMKFTELEFNSYLDPDYSYSEIGYSVGKLFSYEFDPRREPLFDYHMRQLDAYSGDRYDFTNTTDPDQVLLKLKMMLYKTSNDRFAS